MKKYFTALLILLLFSSAHSFDYTMEPPLPSVDGKSTEIYSGGLGAGLGMAGAGFGGGSSYGNPGVGSPAMGYPSAGSTTGGPGFGGAGSMVPTSGIGAYPTQPGMALGSGLAPYKSQAYIGSDIKCPFSRDQNNDANQILGGVINALSDLNQKCPTLSASIQNLQSQAKHLYGMTQVEGSKLRPGGEVEVNCNNYEFVLRKEYDYISANPKRAQRATRYMNCMDGSPACIDQSYANSLSETSASCQFQSKIETRKSFEEGLRSLTEQASALINQSGECSKSAGASQAIASVGVNTLASISALAPMAGIGGLALELGGKLLQSLVNKLFSAQSPTEGIKELQNEDQAINLACLWYALQNRTLNCEQKKWDGYEPRKPKAECDLPQGMDKKNFETVKALHQSLTKFGNLPNAENLLAEFNKPIPDPFGGPADQKTLKSQLKAAVIETKKSELQGDKRSAMEMEEILNNVDELEQKLAQAKEENKPAILNEFKEKLTPQKIKMITNLPDFMSAYWVNKGVDDPFSKIRMQNNVNEMVNRAYDLSIQAVKSSSTQEDSFQSDLGMASNFIVKHFKESFESRLKLLNERYEKNKNEGDTQEITSDLVPLLRMCTLTASIFYTKPVSNPSVDRTFNMIDGSHSPVYDESCKKFQCKKEPSLLPIFKAEQFKEKSMSKKFRSYQCSMVNDQQDTIDALKSNIQKTGKPCLD